MSQERNFAGQVILVDDDPILCEVLAGRLEEAGFQVTPVQTLGEMRSQVRQRFYDVALVDLYLEGEDGLEALPFLTRESPYTKVIVMSAHGSIEVAVGAMEKGASSFLTKSKEPEEMVRALLAKLGPATGGPPAGGASDYGIIGGSPAIQEVLHRIEQVKDVDSTVLVSGESGTGKELVARAVHTGSRRGEKRFAAINCGAIPETLLESELFGHRRGAFTDAKTDRKGLFELCEGGTLFLDEVGEMPVNLQVKLLRVLQEREIQPLGSGESVAVDVRVVAATNRNLLDEVKAGRFREDLYYRLAVLQVKLPALRERPEDIPLLIGHFLRLYNERFQKQVVPPSPELLAKLTAYPWPGNIRELQNAVERGVVLAGDGHLKLEDMLEHLAPRTEAAPAGTMDSALYARPLSDAKQEFEREYLKHLLETTRGNISEMARISGRYRADIYRLLTKHGVEWEEFRT